MFRRLIWSCLVCTAIMAAHSCTFARADVWPVHTANAPITSLALSGDLKTLLFGVPNEVKHIDLNSPFLLEWSAGKLSLASPDRRLPITTVASHSQGMHVLLAKGVIRIQADQPIYSHGARISEQHDINLAKGIAGPNQENLEIAVSSLATNGENRIFVGGSVVSAEDLNFDAPRNPNLPKQYGVWELWRDPIETTVWRVMPLATGSKRPMLLSSKSGKVVLVDDPCAPFQILPGGEEALAAQLFRPVFPAAITPFGLDKVTAATVEADGTVLLSESTNQKVWRLAKDGIGLFQLPIDQLLADKRENSSVVFNLAPGAIAAAPDGGFFMSIGATIYFSAPNDELENKLTKLISEIERLTGTNHASAIELRLEELSELAMNSNGMTKVRAIIARQTLKSRLAGAARRDSSSSAFETLTALTPRKLSDRDRRNSANATSSSGGRRGSSADSQNAEADTGMNGIQRERAPQKKEKRSRGCCFGL